MLSDYQIQRLMDTANAACHNGKPGIARVIYEGILLLKPGFIPANIGQALSHIVVDEFESAEGILKDVLKRSPDDADAQAFLGLAYMMSKNPSSAVVMLEKAAKSDSPAGVFANEALAIAHRWA